MEDTPMTFNKVMSKIVHAVGATVGLPVVLVIDFMVNLAYAIADEAPFAWGYHKRRIARRWDTVGHYWREWRDGS